MGNDTFFISVLSDIGFIHYLDKDTNKTVVIENVLRNEVNAYEDGIPVTEAFPNMSSIDQSILKVRIEPVDLNLN